MAFSKSGMFIIFGFAITGKTSLFLFISVFSVLCLDFGAARGTLALFGTVSLGRCSYLGTWSGDPAVGWVTTSHPVADVIWADMIWEIYAEVP